MKRRNFLKLLGVSPVIPSVLMAKEKATLTLHVGTDEEITDEWKPDNEFEWHEHKNGEWHLVVPYRDYEFFADRKFENIIVY